MPPRPTKPVALRGVSMTPEQQRTVCAFAEAAARHSYDCADRSVRQDGSRVEIFCDSLTGFRRSGAGRSKRVARQFLRDHHDLALAMYGVIAAMLPLVLSEGTACGVRAIGELLCFVSVFLIRPGAEPQSVHYDDKDHARTYFTCFVPATDHPGQGDTEFGLGEPFHVVQGAKIWDGGVPHRGGANRSERTRVALAFVFTRDSDPNRNVGQPFWHALDAS